MIVENDQENIIVEKYSRVFRNEKEHKLWKNIIFHVWHEIK